MNEDTRTDAGEFYPGGGTARPRVIDKNADMKHSEFADVAAVPARFTDTTLRDKLNEVIGKLKGPVFPLLALVVGAAAFAASGAALEVRTAPKGGIYNDEPVVTNVTFDAAQLPAPAGYAAVSNAAMTALQVEVDPTVPAWAKAARPPLPPDYATVSNKAMSAATEAQLEGYKQKQEAVDDPDIDGVEVVAAAIVEITQDANGVIAPVKKTLPTATALYGGQDGLMSGADKGKLDGIEAGAQVNVIEGISVNGESVEPADKIIELAIPTVPANVSSFNNDAGYVTKAVTNGLLAASAAAATYQPKGDYLTEHQSLAPATNYTDSATNAALAAARGYADAAISPTAPAFSNAVLSVGLGIDTNTVAVINELVDSANDLPVSGATSVGALLLALAAAVAALKKRLPYDLVTKTIENGAVTLDDRASNTVEISATLSPNTLTINFPATSGKARDFALRLNIASGVTAPELVLPQGVICENADGEVPEISDGGTGGSSTILYFSETENNGTTAKFLLKGETLAAITQA